MSGKAPQVSINLGGKQSDMRRTMQKAERNSRGEGDDAREGEPEDGYSTIKGDWIAICPDALRGLEESTLASIVPAASRSDTRQW